MSQQSKMVLVEGIYQAFEELPTGTDAIYYYSATSVHVMLFDVRLEGYAAAQKILREHLQGVIWQKLNDARCAGLVRPANSEWSTSLEDLGIQLVRRPQEQQQTQSRPRPLALPAGRRVYLPENQNPNFGTMSGDTTPLPEFVRLPKR